MNSEHEYKKLVTDSLVAAGWHIEWHEDKNRLYIPDVSFGHNGVDGWMEFKYVHKLPTTLGSIHHYTKGQELWLNRRGRAGSGHCYLVLGMPGLHLVWGWADLPTVRDLHIRDAMRVALVCEGTRTGLCSAISRIVHR